MKNTIIIIACTCVFLGFLSIPLCSASAEDDARSAIAAANARVAVCYIAVAETDKAGANVTELLSTLDDAGMFLSRSNLAFQEGDFESAYNLAVQSRTVLDGFEVQANSLKDAAEHSRSLDFWFNIFGSSVGAVGVVVGASIMWPWLKKRQSKSGQAVTDEL